MGLLRIACKWILLAPVAFAQNGSISGTVVDSVTGAPLAAGISAGNQAVFADEHGHYTMADVPPGQYRMMVGPGKGDRGHELAPRRVVTVHAGEDLTGIDFRLDPYAHISGKVLNEDGDPVPGVPVRAITRYYVRGEMTYSPDSFPVMTNDLGEYRMPQLFTHTPYILAALPYGADEMGRRQVAAVSSVPEDPKARRSVPVPSYYPDALDPESGLIVAPRPGDTLEHIDIHQRRSPSLCIEGKVDGPDHPGAVDFNLTRRNSILTILGKTETDGGFRICELSRGEYRMEVSASQTRLFGVAEVVLTDADAKKVRVTVEPPHDVRGEVVLEGPPPERAIEGKLDIRLSRLGAGGERAQPVIPGGFSVSLFSRAKYRASVSGVPQGWYVKDLSYSGVGFLHSELLPGAVA